MAGGQAGTLGWCIMSDVQSASWPSLLIATTNIGKTREIVCALDGLPTQLVTLADLDHLPPEPEETGTTFAANAAIKAGAYARATGLPTVAEDSGLVIDVLDGRPGIHSARYPGSTYVEKFVHLFAELAPHPRPWTARFVCSLAFVLPAPGSDPAPTFTSEGVVEGEITSSPRGLQGFGYDPIFFYPPLSATLGELDEAAKLSLSHRGAAFRRFRQWALTS